AARAGGPQRDPGGAVPRPGRGGHAMNRTLGVVKLGGTLYWREKGTVFGTAVTPLLLGIGLPVLMHRVLDARQATAVFHGMLAVVLAISGFMAITVSLTA